MSLPALLLDFFLPRRCVLCGYPVSGGSSLVCAKCLLQLPLYRCPDFADNELVRIFWKRIPIVRASAMLLYSKGNNSSLFVTDPKLRHRDDISHFLGIMLAKRFAPQGFFQGIDAIIPMPVTASRFRSRGMNQIEYTMRRMSAQLRCMGISLPIYDTAVKRVVFHKSQTQHRRYERIEAMSPSMFSVVHPQLLNGKHILIADDVVTTGATVTALAQAIMQATTGVRFSLLSIGRTDNQGSSSPTTPPTSKVQY